MFGEQIVTNGEDLSIHQQKYWRNRHRSKFCRYLYEINTFIIINDTNIF